ncbi:MinD-like ATPase involved in chromosome partitioning or flagellar assembly [Klenkia marina]|uniref:MinD-like ATPase involved in chromosome partitioning or flagellar assembly n=1 Tax=Klenkia marina TaxID=1960309 RepID=A0A1G4XRQ6_9ACTN|nr:MinD/ParA family protein [Klenkia marina]SCX43837.1 MinD-like ATPase involved in chromosome partitioning or flagellar assembly [Klenkia marina]
MSDRPADPSPDDAHPEAGAASEEARRRTDGERWQASLESWSSQGGATGDDAQRTESGTQEIRLDPPASAPAEGGAQPWSVDAGSWEHTAQQPSVPADERSWEQQSREQIAAWQQPPSWQQAAEAERPADEAAAPSWRPADQPVGQQAPWEQAPPWEQEAGQPSATPSHQLPSHQVPSHRTPASAGTPTEAPSQTPSQAWPQAEQQQSWPQAPQQQAWEPPPGGRPWEQGGSTQQGPHGGHQQGNHQSGHQQGGHQHGGDQQPAAHQAPPQQGQQHGQQQGQQHGQQPGQQWGQQPSDGWGSQGSSSWTPGQPAGPQQPTPPPSLTSQSLLRQTAEAPSRGWRRFLHKASGGTVNPGLSQAEIEHRALVQRVTTPVRGSNRIAVVSLKGGIGKTTTTCCLGLTLAHHRGDRVVAVDANPDAGTLAERLTNITDVTVRDLLAAEDRIRSFTDVSAFTSLAGRLQVLASDQDPALSEAFSEEEYTTVADILARYFNLILTDSGTGLLHSAMSGTLAIADSLVVVGAPSVDGASRASKTLDWLIAHGHEELVSRSVAVISSVRPNTGDVDMGMVRAHFEARCRAVVEIPYDTHLVTGGLIDLDRVGAPARKAYLELAAHVADGFALPPLQRKPAETA